MALYLDDARSIKKWLGTGGYPNTSLLQVQGQKAHLQQTTNLIVGISKYSVVIARLATI